MNFQYETSAHLHFGNGISEQVGKEAARFGTSAMVVTGGTSAKASGLLDKVVELLRTEGIEPLVYDEAKPNPLISTAETGAKIARENGIEVVVALGGGSTIDLAKGICARAKAEKSITEIISEGLQVTDAVPLIAVPTTCGTGTEVNRMGVLTNDENHDKRAVKGPALVPVVALVDPQLMKTLPKGIYASVAFDALCHLMEGFLTKRATLMSDALVREGIRLLSENIVRVYEHPGDGEAWEKVAFASTLGGYALDCVSVIAPHAISHPLGSLKGIAHGRALAAICPVIYRNLAQDCPGRMTELSRMLGGTDHMDAWKQIVRLLQQIDLTETLQDCGIKEEDLAYLANNTLQVQSWVFAGTPGKWDENRLQEVLQEALHFDYNN